MRFLHFLQILGISLALATYSAWISSRKAEVPWPQGTSNESVVDISMIHRAEAEALWQRPSTLFLDVRSSIDYEFGHIAGAENLPFEEFEDRWPAVRKRLEAAKDLVVYCKSIDCAKSLWSAILLHQKGLTQAKIYVEGWYDWSEHKLPRAGAGR